MLRRLRWCLAVVLVLAAAAGCQLSTSGRPASQPSAAASSPGSSSAGSGSSTSGSSGGSGSHSSPAPVTPPPAPKTSGCYRLTLTQLTDTTNQSSPVSCGGRHDAQTIYVGRLHTVVDGHSVAVNSNLVQHQLQSTCPRKLAQFVGGSPGTRQLSRFNVVWFSPTPAQSDQGANWFRCDVVAFAKQDTLLNLPSTGRLHHALDSSTGLHSYGLCGTAAPGDKSFQRVVCAERHSWKAIATIPLSGGHSYPGASTVRNAGDGTCKTRVRAFNGGAFKFSFGWEWPSQAQWDRGQHYGYCWAPSTG